jgi:tetratricopeptide (TPR) repeat protein
MIRVFLALTFIIALSSHAFGDDLQKDIPESAAVQVAQSKELRLTKRDLNMAEKILLEVIAKYPNYYKALYNLGLVYQDKGNYDAAIKALEKAREIREKQNLPEYSIYNTLGWAYMHQGSNKQAEASYKTGLTYEPQNSSDSNRRLYSNLSWFYYLQGDPDEAKKYIDVAEQKYQSESVAELRKLIDQLAVDKQKIDEKSESSMATQQSLMPPKK